MWRSCDVSETVDLTLLSGGMQGLEREVRLMTLQLDQLAGSVPLRLDGIEARLGVLEKTVHDLSTEINREAGVVRQQLTRHEKRFDAVDAGLANLQTQIAESTERLMRAIQGAVGS
jgi:TolA-binding protein